MTRRYRRPQRMETADMNLAPFVDVLFVLLIAFMIPSQFLFSGLDLVIPTADTELVAVTKDPIKILVDRENRLNINGEFRIDADTLVTKISELTLKDRDIKIYVIADENAKYGKVIEVVDRLTRNNFKNVTLLTDVHNMLNL